ncbi:MAG: thioredoxin family protein [Flavisolibacter sp.]
MKKILLAILAMFTLNMVFAQTNEIGKDAEGNKVVKGFISRQELMTDTSYSWFKKNQQGYTPDSKALQELKRNKDSVNFLVFGGTWCGDTKFVMPKFFVLADASGLNPDRITVIGVDHDKKTIHHLSETFNITNVPTIIVFKNGKEIGRVIEYGKHGMFDQDLAEILSN